MSASVFSIWMYILSPQCLKSILETVHIASSLVEKYNTFRTMCVCPASATYKYFQSFVLFYFTLSAKSKVCAKSVEVAVNDLCGAVLQKPTDAYYAFFFSCFPKSENDRLHVRSSALACVYYKNKNNGVWAMCVLLLLPPKTKKRPGTCAFLCVYVCLLQQQRGMRSMIFSAPAFQNRKATWYMCLLPRLRVCRISTGYEQCAFFHSCFSKSKIGPSHVRSSALACVYYKNNGVWAWMCVLLLLPIKFRRRLFNARFLALSSTIGVGTVACAFFCASC